jgi:Ni/Fe-hydrogenase subunit HybB-like protein
VRPAILTSALGYTLAGVAVAVDVGRPWWIWKVPLFFWRWNLNSALLEVALCIMAYIFVLWLELSPAFLERWEESDNPRLARFAGKSRRIVDRFLLWIIALGLLLPTMHQSSLGTVMLLGGPKLHPLWNTPLVPLLFLLSCIAMGYGVVVLESTLSSRAFGRRPETGMLASLSGAAMIVLALWLVLRVADAAVRGVLGMAFQPSMMTFWFWLELALVALPLALLMARARRRNPGYLFQAALWILLGGTVYRFTTYLIAFDPGANWSYVPSIPELFVTLGFISAEILLYLWIVKRFPILAGVEPAGRPAAART